MTARVFENVGKLAAEIEDRYKATAIIGIDGWTGAGKTTLARALAEATGGSNFDIDDALIRDQECFVPALQLDLIRSGLSEPKGLIFISGICLRQVLELSGCAADAHIYTKRMATWGWADEDELTDSVLPEIAGASGEATRREMRAYHREWIPHLKADYEFHRLA